MPSVKRDLKRLTAMEETDLIAWSNELDEQRVALKAQIKAINDERRRRAEIEHLDAQFGSITAEQLAALQRRFKEQQATGDVDA